ncbi:MAG: filamentous hemagglutinin N-terminal domain-containing protein, partial [Luteibacter sp.]
MNYRYQLAWSAALRAAPLALAIALGLAGPAHAAAELPVFGSATGAMPTITVQGDTLTLSQPDPSDTWVDWTSFNIGPGGTVNFLQTAGNATSASHRVTGGTGSTIAGSLSMQGRQVLADARGIVVDTTGVVAGDHLILAGTAMSPAASGVRAAYDFDAGGSPAGVVNRGAITGSAGGSMVLLGSSVRNEGSIATTTGNIQIVAASHVLDAGPVATDFTHTVPALGGYVPLHAANGGQPAIENAGTIDNPGGQIHLVARADPGLFGTLIRNTGTISADYVQYGSIGTVVLDARGGDIDSSGTIRVSGGRVGLISDANVIMTGTIDATGTPYASGYLQIGPGYLDQTAPTPRVAYVGDHAAIRTFADWPSTDDTFGGTIEISARDALHFGGTLDAHGTGGLLVLSSDGYLEADAQIDLGPHKLRDSGGQLDIESGNAMVVTDHVMARVQADGTYTAGGPSQVGAAMLTGADADVLLKSQSNILLDADMAFTGPGIEFEARSGGAIELAAGRSFTFGANGISHVTLTAAGAVDIDAGSRIGLAEPKGYDSLTVTGSEVNVGGEIHAGGFTATARQGAFTQNAGAISAESVKITAPGSVYLGQDNRISSLTVSTGGDLVLRALDPISVSGSVAGTAVIDALSDFSAGSTDFKGLVTVNARDAGFSNQSPLTFGRVRANNLNASTYTGDLTMTDAVDLTGGGTLTSRGSIIQAGGPFSAGAYVRFSASGDLTLDNPSNHFGGNLEVAGRTVRVANDGDISLVGASGGNLWISTGGASGKVTLLGEIHGTSTFIDGSLTMGQAYYVRDEAVTGNLTTTGSLSVIGEHGYLFNSDFSVGGDFTQAVASPTGGTTYASVLNGNTQVHGSTHLVAGGLVVGDSTHNGATLTSNVSVDAGAILSGTGHVVGDVTVAKDGRIAPGDGSQYPQG